ncbi:MAG: CRISPR-associated endonuclease Cas3'' [Bryobacteraceae bacterium]
MVYWAHSDSQGLPPEHPEACWQTLAAHLENVARLAGNFAASARPGDHAFERTAELCGYLHDYGKYTDCFQKMITTGKGRCQHSVHGAVVAYETKNPDAAFAIAGHHAGIPDGKGAARTLEARIREFQDEAVALKSRAVADLSILKTLLAPSALSKNDPPVFSESDPGVLT